MSTQSFRTKRLDHLSVVSVIKKKARLFDRLESAVPLLLREIKKLPRDHQISIAFPDDGAFKRFSQMFPDYPTVICNKYRDGNKRTVKVKDGKLVKLRYRP